MEREIILNLQKITKYPYGLLWTKRALESANIALIVWYLILLSLRASSRKVRKGLYRKYSKVCVYNNISECWGPYAGIVYQKARKGLDHKS